MTQAIDNLAEHYAELAPVSMRELFSQDPQRFEHFSTETAGLLLDYSKNRITSKTRGLLITFAHAMKLEQQIEALFCGEKINFTEKLPALHTALRIPHARPFYVDDVDITIQIQNTLRTMEQWVQKFHQHEWQGFSGKPIKHMVVLGIGGSYLGSSFVCEALSAYKKPNIHCHFVSHLDKTQIAHTLAPLNPETTGFIIASKSFATEETLSNAAYAKAWLTQAANSKPITAHLIALTAAPNKALNYGIDADHILPLWNWVGGRYSLWSAIGLPIALEIGMENFYQFLAGAHAMDQHFRTADFEKNMPVMLALLSFWYGRFFKTQAQCILPYNYHLRTFPRYVQQLEMESNGKHVQKNNTPVDYSTAPIVFGEMGTEGQHSFHQLLYQGTHLIPCDFIATPNSTLFAHCLAQSKALLFGKTTAEAEQELLQNGYTASAAAELALHQTIPGNQPSNTILLRDLSPHTLGALLALYEHKIFTEGVLWNVHSFDQWGVELGKRLAQDILQDIQCSNANNLPYDSSTCGLIAHYQAITKP